MYSKRPIKEFNPVRSRIGKIFTSLYGWKMGLMGHLNEVLHLRECSALKEPNCSLSPLHLAHRDDL